MSTFKIPQGCKPSKACAQDLLRPIIRNAYLRKREGGLWLMATDSYVAVALKVDGDAAEGWVPFDVLTLMERDANRKKPTLTFEQLSETSWRVANEDQSVVTVHDIAKDIARARGIFPDFDKLGDGVLFSGGKLADAQPFGFNPELLHRVGQALGGGVRAEVYAPLKPIRLTAIGYTDRVALQMPVRLFESEGGVGRMAA